MTLYPKDTFYYMSDLTVLHPIIATPYQSLLTVDSDDSEVGLCKTDQFCHVLTCTRSYCVSLVVV